MNDTIPGLEEQQLLIERVVPPQDDLLTTISNLSRKLVNLVERQAEEAAALEKTSQEIKDIAEKRIPDLMAMVGLTELQLTGGKKIQIKPEYYASIPKASVEAAMKWLRDHNMGSIIKEEVAVAPSDKDALTRAGILFQTRESIHPSTLKAIVREQIESGNPFPRELFGAFVATKAVVK